MILEINPFLIFFYSTIISIVIFYIFKKKHILIDQTFISTHKKLINSPIKSIPLCGE